MEIKAINFRHDTTVVSETQYNAHLKLYNGCVAKINEIDKAFAGDAERAKANAVYSYYRGLAKGASFALDSVMLHEEYFYNISGPGGGKPGERTDALIKAAFGSLDGFFRDFRAVCNSARGWCLAIYDQRGNTLRNALCDSHDDGIILAGYPIIVMDMYEHAYFYDYLTDKDAYIEAFLRGMNWDAVEKRARVVG